jgi:hypothetical protein
MRIIIQQFQAHVAEVRTTYGDPVLEDILTQPELPEREAIEEDQQEDVSGPDPKKKRSPGQLVLSFCGREEILPASHLQSSLRPTTPPSEDCLPRDSTSSSSTESCLTMWLGGRHQTDTRR